MKTTLDVVNKFFLKVILKKSDFFYLSQILTPLKMCSYPLVINFWNVPHMNTYAFKWITCIVLFSLHSFPPQSGVPLCSIQYVLSKAMIRWKIYLYDLIFNSYIFDSDFFSKSTRIVKTQTNFFFLEIFKANRPLRTSNYGT